jgi:hypothetical protein
VARTFAALMDEHASALVGRDRERAQLAALLDDGAPPVAVVHGLAGVGKSALLRAFAVDARAQGATVQWLDGATMEPTPRGFLGAFGAAAGVDVAAVADVASVLEAAAPAVVVLDSAERLRLIDGWLRLTLLPALPVGATVVAAIRELPGVWRQGLGPLLQDLRLENLSPADAAELLRRAGIQGPAAAAAQRLAHGHPLSLRLAIAALASEPTLPPAEAVMRPVISELAATYLDRLDPATQRVLQAASVVRRVTVPLLAAMVPDAPAEASFARLRSLSFVRLNEDGLDLDDTVREVTRTLLRAADPAAELTYRRRAWQELRQELRDDGPQRGWRTTADLLYLVENPTVHDAFFPGGAEAHSVESAGADDGDAVRRIAAGDPLVDRWWRMLPESFRVVRDPTGVVVGFETICQLQDIPHALAAGDPVVEAWRAHLRADPLPRGAAVLGVRFSPVGPDATDPASAMAALWLDVKRDYLELRPRLRRVYVWGPGSTRVPAPLALLGFVPLPEGTGSVMLDFGPGSIDGWLTDVVGRELRDEEDAHLDAAGRELVLDGRRVELTKLEAGVLAYLREREGEPVAREALLRDVWGYEWTGGSNVIEVTVSGLRRKLGDRAGALETVRGVGYRLRSLE